MGEIKKIVKVASFTRIPGARYIEDGDGSAEEFFNKKLLPALNAKGEGKILLDFDDTWGYASSFISELAIRLVEKIGTRADIESTLILKTDDEPGLAQRFWDSVDAINAANEA